jgi:superfamily II DNA or RNA helicase
MKVLADLLKYFWTLDINIIEIGCGYGGQCKIIHDLFKPKSYTVVDFKEVLDLTSKWLANFNIKPTLRSLTDDSKIKYDLFISNYAFTEFTRQYQDFYAENIIKNCTMGYITCNFLNRTDAFSVQEILDLMGGKMYEEKPKTGNNNAIYVWGLMR